jgi:hypothetical protein
MHGGKGKDGWCTGVNAHDCECEVVGKEAGVRKNDGVDDDNRASKDDRGGEDNGVGEGDRADGDGLGPPVQG